jgi:hypothetical protein
MEGLITCQFGRRNGVLITVCPSVYLEEIVLLIKMELLIK